MRRMVVKQFIESNFCTSSSHLRTTLPSKSNEKLVSASEYFLSKNGFLIAKIFQGGAQGDLIKKMKKTLSSIKYFKPKASRSESPETYLVAQKK